MDMVNGSGPRNIGNVAGTEAPPPWCTPDASDLAGDTFVGLVHHHMI